MHDFDEIALSVQRECESYKLRHSMDGRRRVIAQALRQAFEDGARERRASVADARDES